MSFAFVIRVLNQDKEGYREGENVQFHLDRICAELGVDLRTAETFSSVGQITDIIKDAIESADIIFAEVSAPNENVWYEVGYADRINEGKVIILCRDGQRLPFDRAHQKTFFFDPHDHKATVAVFEAVKNAAESILSVSAIFRLIVADRPEHTIPEYIQNNPKISDACIQTLRNLARDIERPAEVRRRAIHVLSRVGAADPESLVRLTQRLTDASVRVEIFDLIQTMAIEVPEEVWNNAKEARLNVQVMRAAARAGGKQFALGLLSRRIAEDTFINHERWEPRKHFLILILDNCNDLSNEDLMFVAGKLISDSHEEVTNRFLDWVRSTENTSELTENQTSLLELIQSSHAKSSVREKADSVLRGISR